MNVVFVDFKIGKRILLLEETFKLSPEEKKVFVEMLKRRRGRKKIKAKH